MSLVPTTQNLFLKLTGMVDLRVSRKAALVANAYKRNSSIRQKQFQVRRMKAASAIVTINCQVWWGDNSIVLSSIKILSC